ncbi:uncharacterized protein VP01_9326g1 [Puccinia sorghi]|uniref:Retrotransposon gag domain-containing protein n=1 Tax=Puccinia sorghi TaxID=27349 RepID=A0A0L6U6X9_9BASI|nr:uncharacterized protein VP01_9326g1 [Puccinia sorghi]
MMHMLAKERAQKLATEENLCQTQARLDAAVGQQNQNPPQITPPTTSSTNSMVLAKPQPFNGTQGAAAESLVGQAATWSQQYLRKFFNTEEVAFDKFLHGFKFSFFDHNCQHCAEVALQFIRQTVTVLAYMQEFNSHDRAVGWADAPLMSLYQHGLKENSQLAMQWL